MVISERLVALRVQKNMTQGDIESRTGLLRCYLSRLENGHTIPSIETLEKLANALEIPLYQFFYDGDEPPKPDRALTPRASRAAVWGTHGHDAQTFARFRQLMRRMDPENRKLLVSMAMKMTREKTRAKA
jgi:transcriptional regulator with XRE-family HTH domain